MISVSADFSRSVRDVGDLHLVSLRGELDMETAEGLSDWLIGSSGSTVVVDLSELTFLDSSGIAAFVVARNHMVERGDSLILTRPPPFIRRTLELVGLGGWIDDGDRGLPSEAG